MQRALAGSQGVTRRISRELQKSREDSDRTKSKLEAVTIRLKETQEGIRVTTLKLEQDRENVTGVMKGVKELQQKVKDLAYERDRLKEELDQKIEADTFRQRKAWKSRCAKVIGSSPG